MDHNEWLHEQLNDLDNSLWNYEFDIIYYTYLLRGDDEDIKLGLPTKGYSCTAAASVYWMCAGFWVEGTLSPLEFYQFLRDSVGRMGKADFLDNVDVLPIFNIEEDINLLKWLLDVKQEEMWSVVLTDGTNRIWAISFTDIENMITKLTPNNLVEHAEYMETYIKLDTP